jgi:hypothetical protein
MNEAETRAELIDPALRGGGERGYRIKRAEGNRAPGE